MDTRGAYTRARAPRVFVCVRVWNVLRVGRGGANKRVPCFVSRSASTRGLGSRHEIQEKKRKKEEKEEREEGDDDDDDDDDDDHRDNDDQEDTRGEYLLCRKREERISVQKGRASA